MSIIDGSKLSQIILKFRLSISDAWKVHFLYASAHNLNKLNQMLVFCLCIIKHLNGIVDNKD